MKKKLLLNLLLSSLVFTSCGIKTETDTISSDLIISSNFISELTLNEIIEKAEETLKEAQEEIIKEKEEKEELKKEQEKIFKVEKVESSDYKSWLLEQGIYAKFLEEEGILPYEEIQRRIDEKVPTGFDKKGMITESIEVPKEIVEEYNKREKEKEEGIYYNPKNLYNKYTPFSDSEIIETVNAEYLELHNAKRAELGLPLFTKDDTLNNVSKIRAEEISYFPCHTRPNGDFCTEMIPKDREWVGENLAWVVGYEPYYETSSFFDYIANAKSGFEGLCNSPSHYESITNPNYNKIGIDTYIIHYEDGCVALYTAFEFSS